MKTGLLRKSIRISFLAVLLTGFASFAYRDGDSKTITGEILDMKCYMGSGEHGPGHKDCAASCIKRGSPMGVLADDGKVYLLLPDGNNPNAFEEAKKFAGEKVVLTGNLSEKNGVQALLVSEVKAKT